MESLKVRDYMNTRSIHFKAEMSLGEALDKFIYSKQYGGPVVDEERHLLGWLSERDCIAAILQESYHCEQTARVCDLMRTDVLSVTPDDSILTLAEQQLAAKPKAYPVVEGAVVIGVISRHDILKALKVQLQSCYQR